MRCSTLTVSVFGFATIALAAPQIHSRHENVNRGIGQSNAFEARGLTWKPARRDNNNNALQNLLNFNSFGSISNNDFNSFQQQTVVVITQERGRQLSNSDRQSEQQLSEFIQQQLFLLQVQNWMSDNIRRNHYNSRNNNRNTVIVIVQQVIDNRNGRNNRRWFTRQIESNRNRDQQVVVVIEDQNVLRINGDLNLSGRGPSGTSAFFAQTSASAQSQAQAPVGIYEPNAPTFGGYSPNINLLPSDVQQPQFGFGSLSADPALIVQQSQDAFVSFEQQSQRTEDDAIAQIQAVATSSIVNSDVI